ncbi:MAG: MBL fold metallo-hydrolase [Pirellulales bacterium]|nr:MBL fold metallo-hydrolase [Pirellulales bacterium]
MQLVFLGTTGYHPSETRHTACLMLPELGIVLDAGSGMFRVGPRLVTDELDIFLSHAHLDHIMGLTFLHDIFVGRSMRRVTIHGAADKLAAVREHLFSRPLFPVDPPWEFRALEGDAALMHGGRLTHFPLEHPGGSTGFRLDWPQASMAYVTDTTATKDADYIRHIRGVDLLVHECYFPDAMADWARTTGHSYTTPVAELARQAGVGRLLLVHVNPLGPEPDAIDLNVARAIFPPTEIAGDLQVVKF